MEKKIRLRIAERGEGGVRCITGTNAGILSLSYIQ